jgi:hypothetical protein
MVMAIFSNLYGGYYIMRFYIYCYVGVFIDKRMLRNISIYEYLVQWLDFNFLVCNFLFALVMRCLTNTKCR